MPWRLVLVTVMAGLLHVLGCAHGPQTDGVRIDTLATVTVAAADHARPAVPAAAAELCDHGGALGCTGADEPATAGPRADLPVPAPTDDAAFPAGDAWAQGARSRAPCARASGGHPAGHSRTRAMLGVWRA